MAALGPRCRLSPVVGSRAASTCSAWPPHRRGFSLWGAGSRVRPPRCGARALGCGRRSFSLRGAGSRVQAQQLKLMALGDPRHMDSSQARDQTHVPCIGRWIPNHWTPREVLFLLLITSFLLFFYRSFKRTCLVRVFILFLRTVVRVAMTWPECRCAHTPLT